MPEGVRDVPTATRGLPRGDERWETTAGARRAGPRAKPAPARAPVTSARVAQTPRTLLPQLSRRLRFRFRFRLRPSSTEACAASACLRTRACRRPAAVVAAVAPHQRRPRRLLNLGPLRRCRCRRLRGQQPKAQGQLRRSQRAAGTALALPLPPTVSAPRGQQSAPAALAQPSHSPRLPQRPVQSGRHRHQGCRCHRHRQHRVGAGRAPRRC